MKRKKKKTSKDVKDVKRRERKPSYKRFTPVNRDNYDRTNLYVVDVETYKKEATPKQFWFGCIYGWNYRAIFKTIDEFKQIIKGKRFYGSHIFAHNGGGFDFLVLFGQIAKDNNVKWRGSKFISMKYLHNKITFGDSLNVLVSSVKNVGKALGIEKMELDNIGYIKKGAVPTEQDIDYCIRDCEIVWLALDEIFTDAGKICLTVASLCMRVFRRKFLSKTIVTDVNLDKYFLEAYYGGRTEAFELGSCRKKVADVKSMYPYVMMHGRYPDPSRLKECKRPSRKKIEYLLKNY